MAGKKARSSDAQRQQWYVYMLRCSDNSLYTGITNDLQRRLSEHNGTARNGARYTRARRPVKLVYDERVCNRQAASRREAMLKALGKQEKEALIHNKPDE